MEKTDIDIGIGIDIDIDDYSLKISLFGSCSWADNWNKTLELPPHKILTVH